MYRILNKINGKSYIGQTVYTLENRMVGHFFNARKGKGFLGRAMKKYGIDSFVWYSLIETNNANDLDDWEKHFIAGYRTNARKGGYGYNLDDGGHVQRGFKHSDSSIEKMKLTHRAYHKNHPETAQKISTSVKKLWKDSEYRAKNMVQPTVKIEILINDAKRLTWDGLAQKYDVSTTTIKKWFTQLGIKKSIVKQSRNCWTCQEEEKLLTLYKQGMLVRDIASILNRGECSVKKRIQLLCNRLNIPRSRFRRRNFA